MQLLRANIAILIMSPREQLTHKILAQKLRLNIRWIDVAKRLGKSKEWTTAACLGQMQMTRQQADIIGEIFFLNDEECAWLQIPPHKSSNEIPADPLLYRFYEVRFLFSSIFNYFCCRIFQSWRKNPFLFWFFCFMFYFFFSVAAMFGFNQAIGVYGPALKELIHEEFGDGIMSAVDFTIHMDREKHDAGDRVKIVWSGKFLPYKEF